MFSRIEEIVLSYATMLPLESFVFVGSVLEEIVAPIPSPTVMLASGSLAFIEGRSLLMLIPLAFIGAAGKTIGASVVYAVADRAEDFVMEKFGKFFGVTGADVEGLGRKIGNGIRGYVALTFLRAFPFMPSTILSVGSGILKIPVPIFVTATFLGTVVRDGFYLYAGYAGVHVLTSVVGRFENIGSYLETGAVLLVLAYLAYRFYVYRKQKNTTASP